MTPNILVVMTDQHSRRFLGCYGNEIVRTPNLDRLARQGMRFDSGYCPAPLCVPSRMSFMTSRTPSANRVWNNSHILDSGIPTWAHYLNVADYETALIGRMHFVGPDQHHGFARRIYGECKPRFELVPTIAVSQWREAAEFVAKGRGEHYWYDDQVVEKTVEYLEARSDGDRPFAAVSGMFLPHAPFIAPPDLFDYYYERIDVPAFDAEVPPPTIRQFRRIHRFADKELTSEQVRRARAAYAAMCEVMDANVGRILDTLDRTGLSDNTLVIYTSDHGEMAGEKGCWFKSTFYEGSGGVPLIARLPGVVPESSVSNAICNLMDLGPTFTELAGAPPMEDVGGRSLIDVMKGASPSDRNNQTVIELVNDRAEPGWPSRMIRSGKWKLWVHGLEGELPPSLFDLEADPEERNDLGEDPAHAEIRTQLLQKLHADWDPARASADADSASRDSAVVHRSERTWEDKSLLHTPPTGVTKGLERL